MLLWHSTWALCAGPVWVSAAGGSCSLWLCAQLPAEKAWLGDRFGSGVFVDPTCVYGGAGVENYRVSELTAWI